MGYRWIYINVFCVFNKSYVHCFAAHPGQSTMCEVLIVHTSEASEWADYLKQILTASCSFLEDSIVLYNLNENILLKSQELFGSCKCIIPLLSTTFMDMQNDPDILDTFQDFLQPPYKVVAFLCGVSEPEMSEGYFEHWDYWRKLSSDDEPSVYVSTVLECINNGMYFMFYVILFKKILA